MKTNYFYNSFTALIISSVAFGTFYYRYFFASHWPWYGQLLFVVASGVATTIILPKLCMNILKMRWLRRLFYSDIVGFWYLYSPDYQIGNFLTYPAIAQFKINSQLEPELKSVKRYESNLTLNTKAESFVYKADGKECFNSFSLKILANTHRGISSGKFSSSDSTKHPDLYHGKIFTDNGTYEQNGYLIDPLKVRLYKKNHGKEYLRQLLIDERLKNESKSELTG
jgi:hypothetical protein